MVALPEVLADANRGGGSESRSGHVANARQADGHLVGGEGGGPVGSDNPGRKRKRRNLKDVLKSRRNSQFEQRPHAVQRDASGSPNLSIDPLLAKERPVHTCHHRDTGNQGRHAGAHHPPLRESEPSKNQERIEHDVQAVARNAEAHGNFGFAQALEVLLARHKKHEGHVAQRHDKKVVAVGVDNARILARLLGAPGHRISHDGHQYRGRNVDRYGIFKKLLALCPAALAVGVRDQRGEAVSHSDSEYERNRKNTIGQ